MKWEDRKAASAIKKGLNQIIKPLITDSDIRGQKND